MVIPAYNEAAVIGGQLDALLAQSWDGVWEVVVVDNRSTDATPRRADLRPPRSPCPPRAAPERPGLDFAATPALPAAEAGRSRCATPTTSWRPAGWRDGRRRCGTTGRHRAAGARSAQPAVARGVRGRGDERACPPSRDSSPRCTATTWGCVAGVRGASGASISTTASSASTTSSCRRGSPSAASGSGSNPAPSSISATPPSPARSGVRAAPTEGPPVPRAAPARAGTRGARRLAGGGPGSGSSRTSAISARTRAAPRWVWVAGEPRRPARGVRALPLALPLSLTTLNHAQHPHDSPSDESRSGAGSLRRCSAS